SAYRTLAVKSDEAALPRLVRKCYFHIPRLLIRVLSRVSSSCPHHNFSHYRVFSIMRRRMVKKVKDGFRSLSASPAPATTLGTPATLSGSTSVDNLATRRAEQAPAGTTAAGYDPTQQRITTRQAGPGPADTTAAVAPPGQEAIADAAAPSTTTRSEYLSIATGAGKILLNVGEAVSEALPPLKAVLSALKFIVEVAEKAQETKEESTKLLERFKQLEKFYTTPPDGPVQTRLRDDLKSVLESEQLKLEALTRRNDFKRLVTTSATAAKIKDCTDAIREALDDYQWWIVEDTHRLMMEQLKNDEWNALNMLARADEAIHTAVDRKGCLAGTREDILRRLTAWAKDASSSKVYWLNGHAGSGKSTIAQSFTEWLDSKGRLGASFFCSRGSQATSNLKMVFPTIAYQLATSNKALSPAFARALLPALEEKPNISTFIPRLQIEDLIVKPAERSEMATVVVIDALDECADENAVSTILSLLNVYIARIPALKFFITSRPEPHIRLGFSLEQLRLSTGVRSLHDEDRARVDTDIALFLRAGLEEIGRTRVLGAETWFTEEQVDSLTYQAAGLFIFASTALKFV
ncbi:hypothetical protein BC835DRAFT_1459740, partial [Cytidiella melzeri]